MGIELIERCVWCGKTVCRLPTGIWTHYYESSGDTHWRCYADNPISTAAKPAGVTVKLDGSPMETTEQSLRIRIQQLEDRVCVLEDDFDRMRGGNSGYVDDNLPSDSQHD